MDKSDALTMKIRSSFVVQWVKDPALLLLWLKLLLWCSFSPWPMNIHWPKNKNKQNYEDHYTQSFKRGKEASLGEKKKQKQKQQTTKAVQWLNEIFYLIQLETNRTDRKEYYLYRISPPQV